MYRYSHNAKRKGVYNVKKDLIILAVIWMIAVGSGIFCYLYVINGIASAANRSAVCTPDVRCTPPVSNSICPDNTVWIAEDEATNTPVCKADPTGCPYGDSIPMGPACDKLAPQPVAAPQVPIVTDLPVEPAMVGK